MLRLLALAFVTAAMVGCGGAKDSGPPKSAPPAPGNISGNSDKTAPAKNAGPGGSSKLETQK